MTALTFQLSKSLFVGAEFRQFAAYSGSFFNERVGLRLLSRSDAAVEDHRQDRVQHDMAAADRRPFVRQSEFALTTWIHFERSQFRFKLALALN